MYQAIQVIFLVGETFSENDILVVESLIPPQLLSFKGERDDTRKNIVYTILSVIICCSICFPIPTYSYAATAEYLYRISGNNRYETSAYLANEILFFPKKRTVIITSEENYPDALSAASIAGIYNAPILSTSSKELPTDISDLLRQEHINHVVIIGGSVAVSPQVGTKIKSLVPNVHRIAGKDRIDTAIQIYNNSKGAVSQNAILATSNNFADALSIAPYAFATKTPIFFTEPNKLPPSVKAIFQSGRFAQTFIVGGHNAVSTNVERELRKNRCRYNNKIKRQYAL